MISESIVKLKRREDLDINEAKAVMEEILKGGASTESIKDFLMALKDKGETVGEITGFARTMRLHVTRVNVPFDGLLDTCGTGGDNSDTFNISTVAAFAACGAGAKVAKHGNRSVSSRCGSADLLKELGVNIELSPDKVAESIASVGIGFLFAPLLHPAMKYAIPARKAIGKRTVFNILGPLTNPAYAKHQLLGVYDAALLEVFAGVLDNLETKHALIVHGRDGLDEMTITAETDICELKGGNIKKYVVSPEDFSISRARPEDLRGGEASENAGIANRILEGEEGAASDIVALNAGAALYAADLAEDIKEGLEMARRSIKSGKALAKLNELIKFTNSPL
ncbi:MAG: anthranilate phosphoribosyltransferase [Candidatus Omnitrophica bacterium CG1_02_49_10]|nr:MAG: anthranilate phosphoribosyltransferase [Candidatus Omnitrophica bacterium CG1_02_49_10]